MTLSHRSTATLSPDQRLIVALDFETADDANRLIRTLDGVVSYYKVGLQLFVAEGMPFVKSLIDRGYRVFLDLKMDDVEETIASAVREIARYPVELITLNGGAATIRSAIRGRGASSTPRILSLTLLSSLNAQDLTDLKLLGDGGRFATLEDYIRWRVDLAQHAGCDGFIASGDSVKVVRDHAGPEALIITPGVRPSGTSSDEHKRPTTPASAIAAGADYLVVGRPIRNAAAPRAVAEGIVKEIAG
jgi:orotidine-5'-phosphate decarboxylase